MQKVKDMGHAVFVILRSKDVFIKKTSTVFMVSTAVNLSPITEKAVSPYWNKGAYCTF